jgi:pilus assembly protein CpaE
MSGDLAILPEPDPLRAITVSRDVQEFDLLIEDMETELEEAWGDLTFEEAMPFLRQDDARQLEFIVVAVDQHDEPALPRVAAVISTAKAAGLRVILVAEGLGPIPMHDLLRAGADDFVPYPLPEQALSEAVARVRSSTGRSSDDILRHAKAELVDMVADAPAPVDAAAAEGALVRASAPAPAPSKGNGAIFAVQSASGGNGATTIAVNLAWELANGGGDDKRAPNVCLIDFGLQFGSVATYLDLPRKPLIYDLLTDVASMDRQAFLQATTSFGDKLSVLTAPKDILPLDLIGPEEVSGVLALARESFDIIVIDMPNTLTAWTDTVLSKSDVYYLVCELEVRSAQNALRFQKLLQAEGISTEQLQFILNRAPGRMDMNGRPRIEKMAESLGIRFQAVLPDGGKVIRDTNDQAQTLRDTQARNPLTKGIAKLARDIEAARERIEGGQETFTVKKSTKKKALFGLSFG